MGRIYLYKTFSFLFLVVLFCSELQSQEIDLENIGTTTKETFKKNPFKISGGISANTVFYNSNVESSRDDFNYFLNGNLNVGIYNWNFPLSYTFTNQGSNLGYQIPFKFNRLSLNPKYKWIQAFIGDGSFSYSPYTYDGLIYTGGGLDLSPNYPLKFSMFVGRLHKAIEDDDDPRTIPSFKRMAYGTKISWEESKYKLGLIGFYAKDDQNSLDKVPEQKEIFPQENLVLSLNGSYKIRENLEVFAEYASTGITNDLRNQGKGNGKGIASLFFKGNASTEFYYAMNTGVNLNLKKGNIGVRYERIDPGYRTLGAYYFNNDLENISLNAGYSLFKDKVSFNASLGRQRDNLDHQKLKETFRWVGSINATVQANEKLLISGNYSNFTMYTNKRLNQFDIINENPLHIQQPADSINYKQISQNINMSANYNLSMKENLTQSVHFNYSLNEMVSREDGIVRIGGLSRFHNFSLNYSVGFPEKKLVLSAATNYTNTYAATKTTNILGPSLTVSKGFLENKLTTSLGASYSTSKESSAKTDITNLRLTGNYIPWEKHSFNMNLVQMFRSTNQDLPNRRMNELTATIGYHYNF